MFSCRSVYRSMRYDLEHSHYVRGQISKTNLENYSDRNRPISLGPAQQSIRLSAESSSRSIRHRQPRPSSIIRHAFLNGQHHTQNELHVVDVVNEPKPKKNQHTESTQRRCKPAALLLLRLRPIRNFARACAYVCSAIFALSQNGGDGNGDRSESARSQTKVVGLVHARATMHAWPGMQGTHHTHTHTRTRIHIL